MRQVRNRSSLLTAHVVKGQNQDIGRAAVDTGMLLQKPVNKDRVSLAIRITGLLGPLLVRFPMARVMAPGASTTVLDILVHHYAVT